MLYVQQQYSLHAQSSMSVDVLAVTSLGTCPAAAAAVQQVIGHSAKTKHFNIAL